MPHHPCILYPNDRTSGTLRQNHRSTLTWLRCWRRTRLGSIRITSDIRIHCLVTSHDKNNFIQPCPSTNATLTSETCYTNSAADWLQVRSTTKCTLLPAFVVSLRKAATSREASESGSTAPRTTPRRPSARTDVFGRWSTCSCRPLLIVDNYRI